MSLQEERATARGHLTHRRPTQRIIRYQTQHDHDGSHYTFDLPRQGKDLIINSYQGNNKTKSINKWNGNAFRE